MNHQVILCLPIFVSMFYDSSAPSDPLADIGQARGVLGVLIQHPKLLDFENKQRFFQHELRRLGERQGHQRDQCMLLNFIS